MEEVARMTEAIETVRAGEKGRPQPRFKLSFLLSDKP
jgi:hypothetical protein